eukprot:5348816-Amphidinium_carterae.1
MASFDAGQEKPIQLVGCCTSFRGDRTRCRTCFLPTCDLRLVTESCQPTKLATSFELLELAYHCEEG